MGIFLKSYNGTPDDLDPREEVVGHVDALTIDKVKVMTTRDVVVDKFLMREHILRGLANTYVVHFARLPDSDTYSNTVWVKPSEVEDHGGVDQPWDEGIILPESLLKQLRANALLNFSKAIKRIKP